MAVVSRCTPILVLLVWSTATVAAAQPVPENPRYDRTILGQLSDLHSGAGVPGETVTLRWIPPGGDTTYPAPWVLEMPQAARPTVATGTTDRDGRFGFEGLLPGEYEIHLARALRSDPVPLQVPAAGPPVMAQIEADLGRRVRGQVVTAEGAPVPRADVFIAHVEGQSGTSRPRSLRAADLDGRYLLPGLPDGTLWIEAFHPDHGFSPPVRLDPREGSDGEMVELRLREEAGQLWPLERSPFAGIGISLHMKGTGPEVESVRPDGAAARAGLRPGDRIVEIGGIDARRMPLAEVLMRCRGGVGSELRLTLVRDDGPLEVVLTRAALE